MKSESGFSFAIASQPFQVAGWQWLERCCICVKSVRTLFRCSATLLREKTTSPLNFWESRCKRVKRKKSQKIHFVFKDRLQLSYEPRQTNFKVQLVYIVCRWKWKWFKYDKVLCYLKEMILKMLHQGPRWQFPGPGRYNWEVGGRRQTTSSGWTSSSDCRGRDNAGEKFKDKHNHRDKLKHKHKDNQRGTQRHHSNFFKLFWLSHCRITWNW